MSSKRSRKVIDYFDTLVADFRKHSRRVLREPNVEEVHLLRRTLRRIRSSLWVFRHGSQIKVSSKLRDDLRAWSRALGERRELDVLIQDSGRFHFGSKEFRQGREAADRKLLKVVSKASRKELLDRLEKLRQELRRKPNIKTGVALRRAYERYFPELDRWPKDMTALHQVRIDSKKMRYILEVFGRSSNKLHEFESALGKVHDLDVLKEKLGIKPGSIAPRPAQSKS